MKGWNLQLNDDQIDSLKEVGNVGAGHAASRLATRIGRKCVVSLPGLICADLEGIKKEFQVPESLAVALHMRILGNIPASMLVVTRRPYAERMIEYMKQTAGAASKNGEGKFQLALAELGEVLTRSFSDAIGQFLGTKSSYLVPPDIVMEDWSGAVDSIVPNADERQELQMAIHADFFDCEKTFEGKFVYVLGPKAQAMILERIELLLG